MSPRKYLHMAVVMQDKEGGVYIMDLAIGNKVFPITDYSDICKEKGLTRYRIYWIN
jgi:hypothetical protein